MKIQQAFLVLVSSTLCACSVSGADIHFAGDSTLAPRAADSQIKSWGDMLRPRLAACFK